MPWTKRDVDRFKKGLTDAQKEQWVNIANSVLQKCLADGGNNDTCEASAIRQANGVVGNTVNTNITVQIEHYVPFYRQHQGRQHIVVPVNMMVEGVHNGSAGPLYHSAEELSRFLEAWNGIPIVISHPEQNGAYISANSPDVIDMESVGRIYNTHMDQKILKAEAWIDIVKLQAVSPGTLTLLEQMRPIEVSLGMFTEEQQESGVWNGEEYIAIARNHRPDHLALLPNQVGACSWRDGCGVRAHSKKKGGDGNMIGVKVMKGFIEQLAEEGLSVISLYEQSIMDSVKAVRNLVDSLDNDVRAHYLEDIYEDYIIYRIENTEGNSIQRGNALYKRSYKIDENDLAVFTGDPEPVKRKVEYVTMVSQKTDNKGGKVMTNKEKKGCCPEKVELLIQSEHSTFVEVDRDWLSNLEEDYIDKLLTMQTGMEDKLKALEEKKKKGKEKDPPVMDEAQAIKVLEAKFADPEQFMTLLPKEVRASLTQGLQLYERYRDGIINKILGCTDAYTAEELKEMETPALEKLAKAAKAPVDYSAQSTTSSSEKRVEPLLPVM